MLNKSSGVNDYLNGQDWEKTKDRSSRKPLRRPRPRELRAFFSCMAWRAIPGPLSKRKRRLDSIEAAQRESTAPAQGNQSLIRELRASALCPGLEAADRL